MRTDVRGPVFVMGLPTNGDSGPVAAWIVAANWALAARRALGDPLFVSPEGAMDPEEALARATSRTLAPRIRGGWRHRMPEAAITALKDARDLVRARRFARRVAQ